MAAKSKTLQWRITRTRGNRAELVGFVTAADEESAVKAAIKDFKITDREKQKRLVAKAAGRKVRIESDRPDASQRQKRQAKP
jgi:hypothetical protein